jgi:hypothetical protein
MLEEKNHLEAIRLRMKSEARELKKTHNIKSSHAHEIIAKSWGFNSWNHALRQLSEDKNVGA